MILFITKRSSKIILPLIIAIVATAFGLAPAFADTINPTSPATIIMAEISPGIFAPAPAQDKGAYMQESNDFALTGITFNDLASGMSGIFVENSIYNIHNTRGHGVTAHYLVTGLVEPTASMLMASSMTTKPAILKIE